MFFVFKQKTAYEMRISDWSSDVCSSDLHSAGEATVLSTISGTPCRCAASAIAWMSMILPAGLPMDSQNTALVLRSEEHTSELQSLMRISYAVFCLKKKIKSNDNRNNSKNTYSIYIHIK